MERWQKFTSPSTLEPRNSFNPFNLFNRPGVLPSDHMRPYATISDLQHPCLVERCRSPRIRPYPTIWDHIRPSACPPHLSRTLCRTLCQAPESKIKNSKSHEPNPPIPTLSSPLPHAALVAIGHAAKSYTLIN